MADAPNSRTRTAIFVALVLLIAVLGWVVLFQDGGVERDSDLQVPADANPDASLDETAEELPPLDDEAVLEEIQEGGPETGETVEEAFDGADEAVEDALDPASDPVAVDDIADPEER
ncbi:hypothetical protein [Histidinibacterium lentulum]|uniref:Uncharacterized protein n=1 Tax=Histidinibacterium lentulum TaxID=2480588 RepID=A0A3N2QY43_9RHOB|nr:hypothetical protein [Histidinibacterium lentulum]ROU00107.1 hypothetical protein EAT49_12400 [Histidinibacterium lentulum]